MQLAMLNGRELYYAIISGAKKILNERTHLNKINVFPVPDGDTGNNMSYMMQRIITDAKPSDSISDAMESIANAAISGSRGNSGIIFAEYLNGLYEHLKGKNTVYLVEFHEAIKNGIKKAYEALVNPVEGTILTVLRKSFDIEVEGDDFVEYFDRILVRAKIALEETTNELEILKINKVVDAGASGFTSFLEGMTQYIKTKEAVVYIETEDIDHEEVAHDMIVDERYCTEALMSDVKVGTSQLKEIFKDLGTSLIVSGRQDKMRMHIHTNKPEEVFYRLRDYANIIEQKVDDMIRQQQSLAPEHPRIAIVTDSIADIPMDIRDKYQIHLMPINLMVDNVSFLDKVTITTETFYKLMDDVESFSSSQPDKMFIERNLKYLEEHYDDIIVVTVASKLSGTYNAFYQYAKKNPKIHVIDSKQNSGAQGLVVLEVAKMIEKGKSVKEILDDIPNFINRTKIYVSVKTLKYMVKMGRVKKVTGLIAKIINLKPVISLGKEGEGIIKTKAFSLNGNVKKIIKLVKQEKVTQYIMVHAQAEERASKLALKLEKILGFKPLYTTEISPIVAMNAGIGAIAVALTYEKEVE
ncbi:MAG: DegV family protein [Bacilli bacterium]